MKYRFFENYPEKHVHFQDEDVPELVLLGFVLVGKSVRKPRTVDLGCGNGRLIFALHEGAFFKNADEILDVDISESSVEVLARKIG